jgi:hypothetical protein
VEWKHKWENNIETVLKEGIWCEGVNWYGEVAALGVTS